MPSEFELIARHFVRPTPRALLGPGDDCALLSPSPGMALAVTTDMLVSDVHFFPETDPGRLGWKTLAVNLSDLAAMGARPRWAFLALSFPEPDENWLAAFSEGVFACARRFGVDLAGGDTTRGPLTLCVTAVGEVPPETALRRDAARAGDDLWVSGAPGLAALGLAHRQGAVRLPTEILDVCLDRLEKPQPRVELGAALRENALARAAIDISDGLLADAGHLVAASKLDIEIDDARLPTCFPEDISLAPPWMERFQRARLSGGDDYELLFSASSDRRGEIDALAARLGVPLSRIGHFVEGRGGVRLLDAKGEALPVSHKGFDHFAENSQ
jgi:thiamine-monophosphate kinase